MPGEIFAQEQQKIARIEKESKDADLRGVLEKNRTAFFGKVDEARGLITKAETLKAPETKEFAKKSRELITKSLFSVAEEGNKILNKESKDYKSIELQAVFLKAEVEALKANIDFFVAVDKTKDAYEKNAKPAVKKALDEAQKTPVDPKAIKQYAEAAEKELKAASDQLKDYSSKSFSVEALRIVYASTVKQIETDREKINDIFDIYPDLGAIKELTDLAKTEKIFAASKNITDTQIAGLMKIRQDEITDTIGKISTVVQTSFGKEKPASDREKIKNLKTYLKTQLEAAKTEVIFYIALDKSKKLIEKGKTAFAELNKTNQPGANRESIDNSCKKTLEAFYAASTVLKDIIPQNLDHKILQDAYSGAVSTINDHIEKVLAIKLSRQESSNEDITLFKNIRGEKFEETQDTVKKAMTIKDNLSTADPEKFLFDKETNDQTKEAGKLAGEALPELVGVKEELSKVKADQLPPEMRVLYDLTAAKTISQLLTMADIKKYAETHALADSLKTTDGKKYFIFHADGVVEKTEEFNKLSPEKQEQLLKNFDNIEASIQKELDSHEEKPDEAEKELTEGKKMLGDGDPYGAKKTLLAFYEANEKDPKNKEALDETKTLLANIAKLEIGMASSRLNLLAEDVEKGVSIGGTGSTESYGAAKIVAKQNIENMRKALAEVAKLMDSGKYIDIQEAYKAVKLDVNGPFGNLENKDNDFQGDIGKDVKIFDVLYHQQKLMDADPKVREGILLTLAKAARAKGLSGLAKSYYDQYFSKEIQRAHESRAITKSVVAKKFLDDTDNLERLKKAEKDWEKAFIADYKKENDGQEPGTETLSKASREASAAMTEKMVNEVYQKELKKTVHDGYMSSLYDDKSGPRAQAWREAYGGAVVVENFKGWDILHPARGLFTDQEWQELPLTIQMESAKLGLEISMIMASGGTAAGAVRLASGLAKRALTEAFVKSAGGRMLGRAGGLAVESLAFVTTQGALNGAIHQDWSTFASSSDFLKAWGHNALTLGTLKGAGGLYKSSGTFGRVGDWSVKTGFEGAALTGMNAGLAWIQSQDFGVQKAWQTYKDNFVFSAGIGAVHGLMGKPVLPPAVETKGMEISKASVNANVIKGAATPKTHATAPHEVVSEVITKLADLSEADRKSIDHKPENQPHDLELETTIRDNNQLTADYKNMSKQLQSLEDQITVDQINGKKEPKLAQEIENLKVQAQKYNASIKFEMEIEQEARADFVQKHIAAAEKLHPDIFRPLLYELMMKNPGDYERVIYLAQQSSKLETSGLYQAAGDLKKLTADFATVDGSPLKTAEQRAAFFEKMLKLSPLEREWYTTRPETTIDTSYTDYEANFNKLKEFNAKFLSEKMLPYLIAKNLPVSELIIEIHRWQTRGSQAQLEILGSPMEGYDIAGKVRDVQVHVGNYIAPIAGKIPELFGKMSTSMQNLEAQLTSLKQTNPDAYEKAAVKTALYALQTFVEIHPMRDGNGRTGRILYEYYIVKFLGPMSKYRKLPMEHRDNGESTLHSELHKMNDKLSKTLYESKPLGRWEGLTGVQLSKKIDATKLAELNSDSLHEEFFAKYDTLMRSSP